MTPNQIFGGNALSVILRLVLLSIVVGIVLSALGITPDNLIYSLRLLASRIYNYGFETVEWIFGYFFLGAAVVIPVWIITRIFVTVSKGVSRSGDSDRNHGGKA